MLKKVAGFIAAIMVVNSMPMSLFAASGDKYSVTFTDIGLSGSFAQGTACGENGTSYGTATTIDGDLYVTETDLVTSNNISEGQYYLGSPNAVAYSTLTKDEKAFLKAYKGYRFRTQKTDDATGEITYDYYAFRGWLVDSAGTGQTRNGEIVKPGEQIMVTADTNLTAQWGADVNRNGIADVDEGDFEVLYMPGRDTDGSANWKLKDGTLPPSYTVMAEVQTPIQPYYEITSLNDPNDPELSVAIEDISATYLPKLDEDYAKSNDLHKTFVGWEYDLTSAGQDESTITEASTSEDNGAGFEVIVSLLYDNYYSVKMINENEDEFNAAISEGGTAYTDLIDKYQGTYMQKARDEASRWFKENQTVYNLQPGTKGIIPVREWVDSEKQYKYLLPMYTANTNVVLRAVWEDDLNDNDIPDEDESVYTINYQNNEVGYTGTLPTDSKTYLTGQQFEVQPINGTVPGKIFMGWIDSYWDKQYNLSQNPSMVHYGYAGKYPNKFRLYVSSSDMNWADAFENRWSYLKDGKVYEVVGQSTVGDGTVPHNYEESEAGETFPVYDEETGMIIGTSYLRNTIQTGDKQGEITLTAWWEDDKNNNNIPDIIEPQNKVQFKYASAELSMADNFVGTTNALNNLDPEEDADLYLAYLSGEKEFTLTNAPADMTSFTGSWVAIPKDDQVLGTDAFVPALTPEVKSDLKLIFKDWLYVTAGAATSSSSTGIESGISGRASVGGAYGQTANGTTTSAPFEIESQKTELQPSDLFKLVEDVYLVAVWYNDVNENDQADELETKYTIKYTAGTTDNVTNLPPDETEVLSGLEHEVAEAVPYREGYSFTGWKCSIDGNIYKAEQTFDMPQDSVVFEATWAKTTYLLTYLDKDGHIITAYNYASSQNVALLKLDDFDESGEDDRTFHYTFTGWEDLATGQIYSTSYAMPDKNVTLQAYYTKVETTDGKEIPKYYRVSYNADTSDVVTDIPVDITAYTENSLVIISYTIPVREGWIFKGWNDGTNTYQPGGHFTITTSDITLNAVWEEDKNNQSQTTTTTVTTADESTTEATTEATTETTTETTTSSSDDESKVQVYQDTNVVLGNKSTYPTSITSITTHGFIVSPNPLGGTLEGYDVPVVYTYKPVVTVKDETTGTVLTADADYKLTYKYDIEDESKLNSVESINGWIEVEAMGKYTGAIVLPFKYVKPLTSTLSISNSPAVDVNDTTSYPKYGDEFTTGVLGVAIGDNAVSKLGAYAVDSTTGKATIDDFGVYIEVPEEYGGIITSSGTTIEPGKKYKLTEDSDYKVEYVNNDGNTDTAYVVVTGLGILTGTAVYPFKVTKSGSPDEPTATNITGNAKNNIKNKDLTSLITFGNSYLDYAATSLGIALLEGNTFTGLFDDEEEQNQTRVSGREVKDKGTVTLTDYYKIVSSLGGIQTESRNKFYSLGMYNESILLSHLTNPTGVAMSFDIAPEVGKKIVDGENTVLAVDVLPVLNKELYDGRLDSQATVKVYYNPDAYAEDTEKQVIGSLTLSDLEYNEIKINGESFMTPMWQTISCDISDLEPSDTPTITVALLIPDYSFAAKNINSFRLGLSNMRYGIGSGASNVDQEYTFSQPGLNMLDATTIPQDVTKAVTINGITVNPNPLGTLGTKNPTNVISITNTTTGDKLELNKDYTVDVRYSEEASFGLVVITGIGNYSGTAVLPFKYSADATTETTTKEASTETTTKKATTETTTKEATTETTTKKATTETTTKEASTETTTKKNTSSVTEIGVSGYDIVYSNTSTYPSKINTTYDVYGVKLSNTSLGTVSTTSPKITVKSTFGQALVEGTDYKLSYDWTGKGTSGSPYYVVIEGLGSYSGFIALPFAYSKETNSSSKSSGGGGGSSSSKANGGGGGGGTTAATYQVTYMIGEFGSVDIDDKNYKDNDKGFVVEKFKTTSKSIVPPVIVAEDGYTFVGWSSTEDEKGMIKADSFKAKGNIVLYAIYKDESGKVVSSSYSEVPEVETTSEGTTEATTARSTSQTTTTQDEVLQHDAYISGYKDGTFRPTAPITRAEVCSILAKTLGLSVGSGSSSFSDVPADAWYAGSIEAIKNAGITSGYSDGTFRPNNAISRAEFVTLIAKAKNLTGNSCEFTDVSDSWAYQYICAVSNAGWISGYNDKTFHPNENITRAEAVVIFNKMLGRTPDENYIKGTYQMIFNDVSLDFWGYPYIFEACRTHYIKSEDFTSSHETWVGFD